MVLQQKADVSIWGKAIPGKTIRIVASWDKSSTYSAATNEQGDWKVTLKTPEAGGPYTLKLSGDNTVVLENVLVGEVWLCSGQSNMEMRLREIQNAATEIKHADSFPSIRLLHVAKEMSEIPLQDIKLQENGWQVCSSKSIVEFSAVAYFFARELQKYQHVPVGLINASWGGTFAEAWTSGKTLRNMPDFAEAVATLEANSVGKEELKQRSLDKIEQWLVQLQELDPAYTKEQASWAQPRFDASTWPTMRVPGKWEGELGNFDGIVWFRKEVDIPVNWQGKELELRLGAIDDNDLTFFNGVQIGHTEGWDQQRNYTVPSKLVRKGKATIAIRVHDMSSDGGLYGQADQLFLAAKKQRINLAGEWQYHPATDISKLPPMPRQNNDHNQVTVLYNAMIHPLTSYTIKGVLWYQGENNAARAYQYRELFPLLISDWREQWGYRFPFYFVQLANFRAIRNEPGESDWAELREAQTMALNHQNTGMAVIIDIGEANDIHPKNKQEVGRRLALQARAQTYGEQLTCYGPLYESHQIEGDKIRIRFKHAEGLKTLDGKKLKGFAIAGLDHQFHWAEAVIESNEIVVWSNEVKFPLAVRYAWDTNPVCNLCNDANLPASPFRTDDWRRK